MARYGILPIHMEGSREKIQEEVDRNYKFFQEYKSEIPQEKYGKFVLIQNGKFIDFYTTKEDALTAGNSQFEDGIFSVQKVSNDVIDLGSIGYALF